MRIEPAPSLRSQRDPRLTGTNQTSFKRAALALAVTVTIGYGILSLLLLLWPPLGAGFMKALFHGLDLFHLQTGPDFLSAPYLVGVLVATIGAVLGLVCLYSWIRNKLLC